MQEKSTEPHSSAKNSSNKKILKTTQGSKPPEGFILTNTALNSYVYEYLKPLTEETYALIEGTSKMPQAKELKNKKPEYAPQNRNILPSLIGSIIDTVELQDIEVKEEERRSRRITSKMETPNSINTELAAILDSLLDEEENPQTTGPDYIDILEKVERMNRDNRRKIVEKRSFYLSYLFYRSLLEKIDSSIEILYKKIKKKKKKEEDTSYYQELEELLEKRARFKVLCSAIPEEAEEIEESTLGLENVKEILTEREIDIVKNMLPTKYIESWDE